MVGVETARAEWEEGHRRLEAYAREPELYTRLLEQVDAVTAERWSRDAVAEHAPAPGWPRTLTIVEGEAFHRYQRGAVDYEP